MAVNTMIYMMLKKVYKRAHIHDYPYMINEVGLHVKNRKIKSAH